MGDACTNSHRVYDTGCILPSTKRSSARMVRSARGLCASSHIQYLSCAPQNIPVTTER
ncbi:MAG: hypothetical protein FRX49_13464, partial [Trebouxia sp. A1-2]